MANIEHKVTLFIHIISLRTVRIIISSKYSRMERGVRVCYVTFPILQNNVSYFGNEMEPMTWQNDEMVFIWPLFAPH